MTTDKNKRYNVFNFFLKFKNTEYYKAVKHQINLPFIMNIRGTKVFCYNKSFAVLFTLKDIEDNNKNTFKPSIFDESYKNGFLKGLKYLKKEYGITPKILLDVKKMKRAEIVINSIFYNEVFENKYTGINEWLNTIPLIWSDKTIFKQGYYDSIVHSMKTIIDKMNLINSKESKKHLNYFKTSLKPQEVDELTNKLIEHEYIEKSSSKDFKMLFTNEPIPKDFKKIKWKATTALFTFFISHLFIKDNINLWNIASKCFSDKKGLQMANLAQTFYNVKTINNAKNNDEDVPNGWNELLKLLPK